MAESNTNSYVVRRETKTEVPVTASEEKTISFKYNEPKLLQELEEYVANTYTKHYVGDDNVQAMDLIISTGHGTGFSIGSAIKYASRYGKKNGYNRDDILKGIHYLLFQLYIHDKYNLGEKKS